MSDIPPITPARSRRIQPTFTPGGQMARADTVRMALLLLLAMAVLQLVPGLVIARAGEAQVGAAELSSTLTELLTAGPDTQGLAADDLGQLVVEQLGGGQSTTVADWVLIAQAGAECAVARSEDGWGVVRCAGGTLLTDSLAALSDSEQTDGA